MSYIEYLNTKIRTMNGTKVIQFPIKEMVNGRRRKRTEFEKEQLQYFDVIDFKEDNPNA